MRYTLRFTLVLANFFCILLASIIFPISASAHTQTPFSSSQQRQTLATQTPPLACGEKSKKALQDGSITAQTCFRQLSIGPLLIGRIEAVSTLSFASNLFYEWRSCSVSMYIEDRNSNGQTQSHPSPAQDCFQAARSGKTLIYKGSDGSLFPGLIASPGHTYIAITTIIYEYGLDAHPATRILVAPSLPLPAPSPHLA